ncbi:MarR family transcriptional regulator [candidate division FCPU426 bacterium]|nr:MarR family transcriptional regulator [candidate division FCPU426 bacterium]
MKPPNTNILSLISKIRHKTDSLITHELSSRYLAGLAPSHSDIFLALFRNKQMTMKELADVIDRDKSTVTTLINKMVSLGFVKRATDPKDKRICRISLTPRGTALKPVFTEIAEVITERMHQCITPLERESLVKLLTKVNSYW